MSNKVTVIYHRADFDGIFCREIAKKFMPEATLIGWDYGDSPVEFPKEGTVYVLDLSPDLFGLAGFDTKRLIWIDHHKSAIDKYKDVDIPGYRIDGVAACRLTWQWFYVTTNMSVKDELYLPTKEQYINREVIEPYAVRLAGEYDIWDKRDPDTELFQHGLRSRELSDNIWEVLLTPYSINEDGQTDIGSITVEALLDAGESIQYAKTKENESIIKNAGYTIKFEGLTFLACNHARFNSHLFTAALTPEHDACLGYCYDGKKWKVSMYHAPGKEHHDLSLIAVKYGGGGHKGACGFTTQALPMEIFNNYLTIIKSKSEKEIENCRNCGGGHESSDCPQLS